MSDAPADRAPLGDAPLGDAGLDSAPSGDAPLLELRHLTTTIATPRGVLPVVSDASLTLARGATLGVVGETGSGKTMLIRSIMGLLPAANITRSGQARYDGTDLVGLSADRLASQYWGTKVAMVFQDPMTSLAPALRIGRQLTDGLRHHRKLTKHEATAEAIAVLAQVGMPDPERRVRQFPHELSGGLRQRVTIALALSCNPTLLLADEPTTALDVTISAQILDLLARLSAERSMGVVLVSHDLGVIASRTDALCVMYAGHIVEMAKTTEVFAHPHHPYTVALMGSIPRKEHVPHAPLAAIAGTPPNLSALPIGCAFAPRCPNVQARCRSERPPLTTDAAGHQVACFFPLGTQAVTPARNGRPEVAGGTGAGTGSITGGTDGGAGGTGGGTGPAPVTEPAQAAGTVQAAIQSGGAR